MRPVPVVEHVDRDHRDDVAPHHKVERVLHKRRVERHQQQHANQRQDGHHREVLPVDVGIPVP